MQNYLRFFFLVVINLITLQSIKPISIKDRNKGYFNRLHDGIKCLMSGESCQSDDKKAVYQMIGGIAVVTGFSIGSVVAYKIITQWVQEERSKKVLEDQTNQRIKEHEKETGEQEPFDPVKAAQQSWRDTQKHQRQFVTAVHERNVQRVKQYVASLNPYVITDYSQGGESLLSSAVKEVFYANISKDIEASLQIVNLLVNGHQWGNVDDNERLLKERILYGAKQIIMSEDTRSPDEKKAIILPRIKQIFGWPADYGRKI